MGCSHSTCNPLVLWNSWKEDSAIQILGCAGGTRESGLRRNTRNSISRKALKRLQQGRWRYRKRRTHLSQAIGIFLISSVWTYELWSGPEDKANKSPAGHDGKERQEANFTNKRSPHAWLKGNAIPLDRQVCFRSWPSSGVFFELETLVFIIYYYEYENK